MKRLELAGVIELVDFADEPELTDLPPGYIVRDTTLLDPEGDGEPLPGNVVALAA